MGDAARQPERAQPRMTALKRRIVDLIGALGPIPVSDYMALCLSDPRDGYYMTRDPLGRDGDFITAPEISQMFGELVGVWIASMWAGLGRPEDAIVAEIGPGRGTLMKDMARTLGRIAPELRRAGRFFLVETSPRLALAQATTLEGSGGRFDWVKMVDELPDAPLLIVGNELFDAIPVRQYVKAGGHWRERMVDLTRDEDLVFAVGAGGIDAGLLPADAAAQPDGAVFEAAPARVALMETIADRIARNGGAALFIDYGHLQPGFGDTLQAMRAHASEDVFASPGEADLTTHVDFAALAAAARSAGLDANMATQGDLLLAMGLLERAGRLGAGASDAEQERITGEVDRLAGPGQMGTLFKVLAVAPRGTPVPGFGPAD